MRYIPKILLVILMICILCSCEGTGGNVALFKDKDKVISDNRITDIIYAIEQKDSDKLISMFSITAKNDTEDLEEQAKLFIEKFDDSNLNIQDNAGPIVYDDTENGKKSKKIINWYEVYGDNNNYTIFFVEWAEDTFDKDNVGLYTLRIIEEKDFNEQFMEHSKMEIAGIYYNPTND